MEVEVRSTEELAKRTREFIQYAPLYQKRVFIWIDTKGSSRVVDFGSNIPRSTSLYCDSAECKDITTWSKSNYSYSLPYGVIDYTCALCNKRTVRYYYRQDNTDNSVIKVGQYPSLSIDLPRELRNVLKDDEEFYKKALICRNHGYGIGAVGYIRRVIEDKADLILSNLIELKKMEKKDREVKELEVIIKSQNVGDKLTKAAEHIPDNLRPGNQNPLSLLYKNYSVGIHSLSDEECIIVFDQTRLHFDYILINLKKLLVSSKAYIDNLQKITKKTAKK